MSRSPTRQPKRGPRWACPTSPLRMPSWRSPATARWREVPKVGRGTMAAGSAHRAGAHWDAPHPNRRSPMRVTVHPDLDHAELDWLRSEAKEQGTTPVALLRQAAEAGIETYVSGFDA